MLSDIENPHQNHPSHSASEADLFELRILRAVRRIVRSVDVHSKKLGAHAGVTVPQLLCLISIQESGQMSIRDLARNVDLSPSVVVGIVDRLEANGYLTRARSTQDRRKIDVALTEAGEDLIRRAPSPIHEHLQAGLGSLSELERATIALSLERLLQLLEPVASPPVSPEASCFIEPVSSPTVWEPDPSGTAAL